MGTNLAKMEGDKAKVTNKQRLELLYTPKPCEPLEDINAWARVLRDQGTPVSWAVIISLLGQARMKVSNKQ